MTFARILLVAAVSALATVQAGIPEDVAALMDMDADPCDDFYQYACGGWTDTFTLPDDQQAYAYSFHSASERNERVVRDIINEDWPLIGELYESCMALDALSARGNEPLQQDLARINAATSKTELLQIAGDLGATGASLFTTVTVAPHVNDTSLNVLYAGSADVVLPDARVYFDDAAFAAIELSYRTYISTILALAGFHAAAPPGDEPKDMDDVVVSIELQFAHILPTKAPVYEALTYDEACARFPLTFQANTDGLALLDKASITADSPVLFGSLAFMDRAEALVASLALEDLRIHYSFLYVKSHALYLGDAFLQADFEFFGKVLEGQSTRSPRERVCIGAQTTFFPELIGRYYFLRMFDVEREENVRHMAEAIEQAMAMHIATITWLDDATRAEAAAKLVKIKNQIGRSTQKISYPFVLTRDDYVGNVRTLKTHAWRSALAKINQPVDHSEWVMAATSVNAYYSPWENKIVIPAGILQAPFFGGGAVHPVQNFGAIGAVIGHELTHGFDPSGRHYDGDGNQREWWTEATANEFEARAACLKEQYSAMTVYSASGESIGQVNGDLTVAENIADNGGVSLALDAYYLWVRNGGAVRDNSVDERDVEKLFFVSFAQLWCGKIRDSAQKKLLETDAHAPKPVRVNAVAMNSKHFARAFQCKRGSKMNPKKKCKLW